MVMTPSTMLELGTEAPDFDLPDFTGRAFCRSDFEGQSGLLVMFICNHCPFVKHIRTGLADFAREYQSRGLPIVAINSNDLENYPQDGPEGMKEEAESAGYVFPYLLDETQETAKTYKAACTPDFFLFDQGLRLVYRGQFDASRPGKDAAVTGEDLRAAADAVLDGQLVPEDQKPSIGCNIKWAPGNEPAYFSA